MSFLRNKKIASKVPIRDSQEDQSQRTNQQEEMFKKVSHTFTSKDFHASQHAKVMKVINEQLRRPQTSKSLKKDYKILMSLADCNKMVIQSRRKSLMSYKKMKSINRQCQIKKQCTPISIEIQNTESILYKKKNQKYSFKKFKNYIQTKQNNRNQLNSIVQTTLYQGIRDIKNYIPAEAKLNEKLTIFGKLMQQQIYRHMENIKKIIIKQKQKCPNMNKNYQIYLINHYLMSELMSKISQDISALQLKKENCKIYHQIKNEMVSEMIEDKGFMEILKNIQQHLTKKEESQKFQDRKNKIAKQKYRVATAGKKRKQYQHFGFDKYLQMPNKSFVRGKQNEIIYNFEQLYEQVQQRINKAQLQLKYPMSPRKNNFFSLIEVQNQNF